MSFIHSLSFQDMGYGSIIKEIGTEEEKGWITEEVL